MPTYFKGVAPGTHLHTMDLRLIGLAPRSPGSTPDTRTLVGHIAHGTTLSSFISLTTSYGVAEQYALAGRTAPTASNPGHVYEIELFDPLPRGLTVVDPTCEVSTSTGNHWLSVAYHHDGDQEFLLGLVDPSSMASMLVKPARNPPGSGRTPRAPGVPIELEALVRALRDSEVLVTGNIPRSCFVNRYDVY